MGPSYLTVLVPLTADSSEALKIYLRDHANPLPPPSQGGQLQQGLQCRPDFPFDSLPTLHFCSFLVLDADQEEGLPAQLVFEATFDGAREAFVHDLLIAMPAGLDEVFRHCRGYPLTGVARERHEPFSLVERTALFTWLVGLDVGATCYFSGSPGRTVGQIRDEHRLRTSLADDLAGRRLAPTPMPATNAGLQKSLQERVERDPGLAFATAKAPVPWEVRRGDRVLQALGVAGLGLVALFGALFFWIAGVPPSDLDAWDYVAMLGHALPAGSETGAHPLATTAAVLLAGWIGIRAWEIVIEQQLADPHRQASLADGLSFILLFVRLALTSLLLLCLILAVAAVLMPTPDISSPAVAGEIAALRERLGFGTGVSGWRTAAELAAIAAFLALCSYRRTSLQLAMARKPGRRPAWRRISSQVIALAEIIVLVIAALLVLRHGETWLEPVLRELHTLAAWAAPVLLWIAAGLSVPLVLQVLILVAIRVHEARDRRAFACAEILTRTRLGNAAARAREERGSNVTQNHLASITYVKPGAFRLVLLRLTLRLIGFLARFQFNHGNLGGIPTILSARWVIIDNGRRLIFLDNYGGGWESYLNEFIDMGAVKGLNAIWTNTFIKWRPDGGSAPAQRVAFPETRYATARGAQAERPFKRYVRWSQVETLAWYGAYHTLSIVNINTSTDVRQRLFAPLPSHEVDALVSHL
ncbi:MAG: hypothetical protein EKK41_16420 [Hyphomicrobiales bacterium]|nr:MAG: hypothetical protein EKK41_16420 [Hyphomicrobiales bacterium]